METTEKTPTEESERGSPTLVEWVDSLGQVLLIGQHTAFAGLIWIRTNSGDSSLPFAIADRLWSCLGRATAAFYRLQSWMALNDYAHSLTIEQILRSFTIGSVLLSESVNVAGEITDLVDEYEVEIPQEYFDRVKLGIMVGC